MGWLILELSIWFANADISLIFFIFSILFGWQSDISGIAGLLLLWITGISGTCWILTGSRWFTITGSFCTNISLEVWALILFWCCCLMDLKRSGEETTSSCWDGEVDIEEDTTSKLI